MNSATVVARVAAAVVAVLLTSACSTGKAEQTESSPSTATASAVMTQWRIDADSLATAVAMLDSATGAIATDADVDHARQAYREARRHFKHAELALEYYAPSTSRSINGAPVPEVEETEGPETVFAPTGFQVIEGMLFGVDAIGQRGALATETGSLREHVTRARNMLAAQQTTDAHVWDAARLEISRVLTLGLAGFDAGSTGDALKECNDALLGVERTLSIYHDTTAALQALRSAFANARAALDAGGSPDGFNHLAFIAQLGRPLALSLVEARNALHIGTPSERRAFRMTAASVFDDGAIDPDGFAPLGLDHAPPERIALGRDLFGDARLSGAGGRSCKSCHIPEKAFTDGLARSADLNGDVLPRNTPTVINSGLQVGQFADLRTTYLEDQVTAVVENPREMHGNLTQASNRLAADSALRARFAAAFPKRSARDSAVTPLHIRQALAAYVRSVSQLNTPVDRALRGDTLALTAGQRAGFNLFVGKARCATCHFLPLTNGTVPPMYQRSELEVLGVPQLDVPKLATIDPDGGRYTISRSAPHRYAFRTPTLRNVAQTAPYMHNGAFATLDAVIEFYNRGGGSGIGVRLDNQTLPPARLELSDGERRALKSFLTALTELRQLSLR